MRRVHLLRIHKRLAAIVIPSQPGRVGILVRHLRPEPRLVVAALLPCGLALAPSACGTSRSSARRTPAGDTHAHCGSGCSDSSRSRSCSSRPPPSRAPFSTGYGFVAILRSPASHASTAHARQQSRARRVHVGVVEYAAPNRTPSRAIRSRFGVRITAFPAAPRQSPRHWSAISSSTLGRSRLIVVAR